MSKNLSPRKGTPMYRLRAKEILFRRAVELLGHGLSIRTTARLLKVGPNTIQRWKKRNTIFNQSSI